MLGISVSLDSSRGWPVLGPEGTQGVVGQEGRSCVPCGPGREAEGAVRGVGDG